MAKDPRADGDGLIDRSARTSFRIGFDRWVGRLLPLLFLVAILPILSLVYYVSARAIPTLSWAVFASTDPYRIDSLRVPILSTVEVMGLATLLAVAFGLFGGIAVAEFLRGRPAELIRTSVNLLVGTPSVVLGYMGYFLFVLRFGWGLSFLAGVFTLAFFMTPYVFRTADLAFSSIPAPIREAAYGSGAKPAQYVVKVGVPIAFPQIVNGVFLALAIGVGETAPIVLTTTPAVLLPQTVLSPVTFLTELIWANFAQAPSTGLPTLAFQAAFILLVIVVGLNVLVRLISARYRRRLEGLYQ